MCAVCVGVPCDGPGHCWVLRSRRELTLAERLYPVTGMQSAAAVDDIMYCPRFYDLYDAGTGVLACTGVDTGGTSTFVAHMLAGVVWRVSEDDRNVARGKWCVRGGLLLLRAVCVVTVTPPTVPC